MEELILKDLIKIFNNHKISKKPLEIKDIIKESKYINSEKDFDKAWEMFQEYELSLQSYEI